MPKAEQRREIRTVPGRHRAGRGRSGATLASARDPRPETAHRATFPKPQAEPSGCRAAAERRATSQDRASARPRAEPRARLQRMAPG
ncbi:MAG: hypothetical protein MZW92_08805 [Comamonadaceae bacterium]|nr:hypothetical protein [Comamonadaceae bacterium]